MRLPIFRLMAIAVLCLVPAVALAQQDVQQPTSTLPPETIAAIDAVIASQMQEQELVGVSLGVIYDGQIAYLKGYGLADIERKTPVTPQTVFNWASNSKVMLAVAAMQLVQQGKLDLDADVRTYLPEYPHKGHTITSRHLLCHTSGIPHYANGEVPLVSQQMAPLEIELDPMAALNRFAAAPLLFPPGERLEYSSYAYVVLSAVVQRAGKQPLWQQLQTRILGPLNLRSFQLDMPYTGQPDWASGYKKGDDGVVAPVPDYAHFWKHGAGGYKSNVIDFAKWAQAILNHKLIDEATEQQMWTRQKTTDGQETRYGLGIVVAGSGDDLEVSHGGRHAETRTHMRILPARKVAVVVMTNCGHADASLITGPIAELLLKQKANGAKQGN